uniref:Pp3 n=1 Tax=Cladonema pacificum TaxID=499903 RepID=A0A1W6LRY7_9CNID|nr:pp3 precursor [Cladonema pacificum]
MKTTMLYHTVLCICVINIYGNGKFVYTENAIDEKELTDLKDLQLDAESNQIQSRITKDLSRILADKIYNQLKESTNTEFKKNLDLFQFQPEIGSFNGKRPPLPKPPGLWGKDVHSRFQIDSHDISIKSSGDISKREAEKRKLKNNLKSDDASKYADYINMDNKRSEILNGPPGLWGREAEKLNGPPGLWGRDEKVNDALNGKLGKVHEPRDLLKRENGKVNGPPGLWGREIGKRNGPPGLWGRDAEMNNGPPGLWGRDAEKVNGPPGLWGRDIGKINAPSSLQDHTFEKNRGPPGLWGREIEKVNGPPGLWGREIEKNNGPPGLWGRELGMNNGPPGLWGRDFTTIKENGDNDATRKEKPTDTKMENSDKKGGFGQKDDSKYNAKWKRNERNLLKDRNQIETQKRESSRKESSADKQIKNRNSKDSKTAKKDSRNDVTIDNIFPWHKSKHDDNTASNLRDIIENEF